jgi:ribonuclease VapC
MSEDYVLDSSAVICLLGKEQGFAKVQELARHAVISTVNLSEVISKLQERGGTDDIIAETLADLALNTVEFDTSQAYVAGTLRNVTRSRGLSLGDRACLALAAERDGIAVTTDRAWGELEGIGRVLVIR